MISNSLRAGALVLALAAGAALPAHAGSVSIYVAPKGKNAEGLRKGLELYGLFRDMKSRAKVDQRGSGNAAGIAQSGSGNNGLIVQRGKGHAATLSQNGNDNAFGIFQFGKNRSADVAQTGNGKAGLLIQGGW